MFLYIFTVLKLDRNLLRAIEERICFDTKNNLGVPLTRYIDTFVGISGPNHGMTFKVAGLPVPTCALGTLPICDRVIGLYSGFCPMESDFLHDINGKYHYEGDRVYSIYSHADEKIGYKVCDKVTASIDGEDGHKSFRNLLHDDTLKTTHDLQISMIKGRFRNRNAKMDSINRRIGVLRDQHYPKAGNKWMPSLEDSKEMHSEGIKVSDEVLPINELEEMLESQKTSIQNIRRFYRGHEYDSSNMDQTNSLSSKKPQHANNEPLSHLNTDEK
uniref:YDG domain-containing protein n=1 Tax=Angiostrongylus cantonensis TaxID=6313 RepID=A0A0K0D759_ANGCA